MNKKLIVRIAGGVGNQLFMYAAARRLALKRSAELVIDDVTGFLDDYEFKRFYQLDKFNINCRIATASERLEPFSRARRFIKIGLNNFLRFENTSYIKQKRPDFDERLLSVNLRSRVTYLEGYWQSENYFKDIEQQIREDFRIILPMDSDNHEMSLKILKTNSVALHVRFFDLSNFNLGENIDSNNIEINYYQQAIALIKKRIQNPHFFIFSDQPQIALNYLDLGNSKYTLVDHNKGDQFAVADLKLMSLCNHFIIANSTYSWWAAWLGLEENKIVIAPGIIKKKHGPMWGFKGLIPNEWFTIV